MAGQIRPNPKLAKIVYNLQKTPKDLQQKNQKEPTERQRKEWYSSTAMSG